ncbi:WcaI family glycosyltransferase [Shewanella glacialimarina]|uniref:WcaI family glycosyltransferase n=1 Tax=Shewanella glacialimarina TaxID=2590884 RepID=UPI001CF8E53E|nr:WcaI family glycosyltransferase [Shewanella glacialimarina]UCX04259.1 colanic acid biosynthesis glycosyltransferase WcaI [Shewanella glacialimarina]
MKLFLKSLNYSPELTGIGKYNGEMCPELVKRGLDITAIVAPPYYPEWQVHKGFEAFSYKKQNIQGVSVLRCPLYVPKNVTTLKRIIHLASFAVTSALALTSRIFNKPDVIMLVQPTLFCAPFTLLYAKLTGAKAVMHIQDYEIDALFGLGMMGDGVAAKSVKAVERWLMRRFDAISTISYSMIENAKAKGVDAANIIHFPNWSDTEFVTPDTDGSSLKAEWGFSADDKVILYAGNIGNKQGLEIVLEAAKHFSLQPHIKFVLVGAGAYVDTLKANASKLQLSNVFFKPLQAWAKVPQMLALADVHLVVQRKGAADAVLPSKLTNILSAGGHAIVTAEAHTELGQIAAKYPNIYDCVEPENTDAFITGLNTLLSRDLTQPNSVARGFAVQFLNKNQIIDQFVSDLTALVRSKP